MRAASFAMRKHKVDLLDEASLVVVTRGSPEHLDLSELCAFTFAPTSVVVQRTDSSR